MNKKLSSSRIMIASVCLILLCFAYVAMSAGIEDRFRFLSGIGGTPNSWGIFRSANGNAGLLNFGQAPATNGYTGTHVYSTYTGGSIVNTLTGYFWAENIGWIGPGGGSGVVVSPDPTGNPRGIWTLSGYLWNESAGWIDMNNVVFIPDTRYFSGFAWNSGIGWIDMGGAMLEGTSSGFIGKVKIIGNIGGSSIYSTVYDAGDTYAATQINSIINDVQRNLTLLMRNVGSGQINTVGSTNIEVFNDSVIYQNTGLTLGTVRYSDVTFRRVGLENVRSLIIIGANLSIDQSVLVPLGDTRPRAIIVLPNDQGVGGNIYVAGSPTRIEGTIIAGGSLFSAYVPPDAPTDYIYYNFDASSIANLPDRQLYIYGSLISHNTIGGSTPGDGTTFICPYIEVNCTRDTSIRYDLNYFRDYQRDPQKRGYPTDAYDDWSIVIDYNPGLIQDPPPGLN